MNNILQFPGVNTTKTLMTPIIDDLERRYNALSLKTDRPMNYDFKVLKQLEIRMIGQDYFKNGLYTPRQAIKDVNGKLTIDSYGRGCVHDCLGCPVKKELKVHGYWNRPFPMISDFVAVLDKLHNNHLKLRLTGVHLGFTSDPFMFMDMKYKVTLEIVKALEWYDIPYTIRTMSDLVTFDEYLAEMTTKNCKVAMVIPSNLTDQEFKEKMQGAPNKTRRLKAVNKLEKLGFNVKITENCIENKDL